MLQKETNTEKEAEKKTYLQNFEDDSSSLATTDYQTEQEVDPMTWHPVEKKDYQSYRQGIYNLNTVPNDSYRF